MERGRLYTSSWQTISTERDSQGGRCQEMMPEQLLGAHGPALREQVCPLTLPMDRFSGPLRSIDT